MSETDPRREIVRIEARIEQLAETIERCRKLMLISKLAIAAGGVAIVATWLGAIRSDPAVMIAGLAAAIGGIVLLGSNGSTAEETSAELAAAEAERAELIGRIDLRLVPGNDVSRATNGGIMP
jgi:hypothetical protein